MSTEPAAAPGPAVPPDAASGELLRRRRLLEESIASAGRIALPEPERDPAADLRGGGDPSKAPASFRAVELGPIEMASSGTSWDDPEEL